MANTNDLIYSKLKQRFPTEGATIGDLLARYREGLVYLDEPAIGGNDFVQTPGAGLSGQTRLFVAVDVALDDWSPATIMSLISKYTVLFSLKSWLFQILTTGVLRAIYSTDGSVDRTFDSTVNLAAQGAGSRLAVGADIEVNDGAGNRRVTFYTAPTLDGTWAQLGAVVSQVGADAAIFNASANIMVGGHVVLTTVNMLKGKVFGCEVRDAVNGNILLRQKFDSPSMLGTGPWPGQQDKLWTPNFSAVTSSPQKNVMFTPDKAEYGNVDLDIRAKVKINDWTPSSTHWIINQGDHTRAIPDLQWTFSLHPNGALRTFLSSNGTLTGAGPESIPTGFVDGSTHFLRCTVDADNGAANSVFTYYESFDEGLTWVTIGSPILDVVVATFNTAASIQTGLLNPGTQTLFKAELRSSINGPVVMKAEFPLGGHNFVDLTGNSWVLQDVTNVEIVQDNTAIVKYEDYVAHVAGGSASQHIGDDENGFWDAFVP